VGGLLLVRLPSRSEKWQKKEKLKPEDVAEEIKKYRNKE
jgi:hypothetical protein